MIIAEDGCTVDILQYSIKYSEHFKVLTEVDVPYSEQM